MAEECQRILDLGYDTAKTEERKNCTSVESATKVQKKTEKKMTAPNPCYVCGGLNFKVDCPFKN